MGKVTKVWTFSIQTLFLDENGESAIWEQFPNNPVGSFYIFVVDFLELIGNLPSQVLVFALHCLCACKTTLRPYLIFVTGTTGAARVKISVRCKFFQIERQKLHI